MTDATPATPVPSTVFDPSAPVPEEYDVFCHACGYSLVGLAGDRCPECGKQFNPGELPYARVAWLHRRRIGFWTGYWRTVRHVVFNPRSFAEELCRPVRISADDAKRFRRLTIYFVATSGLVATFALFWIVGAPFRGNISDVLSVVALLAGGWLGTVIFLRLATDMPLFIWKGLPSLPPSELAPLHHYAAAPLALTPGVMVAAVLLPAMVASARLPMEWVHMARVGAVAAVAAWVLICWHTPLVLMKTATGCDNRRVALLALYLPFHWLLMAALTWMSAAVIALGVAILSGDL